MTFRAKQPSAPRHRSTHDQEARQRLYVTIGFIAVIAAAIGILIAAVAVSYYNDHLQPVVTVDGQDVSRDAYVKRAEIELFRITEAEKRVREALSAGEVSQDNATTQLQLLSQQRDERHSLRPRSMPSVDEILLAKIRGRRGNYGLRCRRRGCPRSRGLPARAAQDACHLRAARGRRRPGFPRPTPSRPLRGRPPSAPWPSCSRGAPTSGLSQPSTAPTSARRTAACMARWPTNPTDRRRLGQGALRPARRWHDGGHRGRRWHLPHRPRDRDHAGPRGPQLQVGHRAGPRPGRPTRRPWSGWCPPGEARRAAGRHCHQEPRGADPRLRDPHRGRRHEEEARAAHILYSPNDDPGRRRRTWPTDDPAWAAAKAEAEAAVAKLESTPTDARNRGLRRPRQDRER